MNIIAIITSTREMNSLTEEIVNIVKKTLSLKRITIMIIMTKWLEMKNNTKFKMISKIPKPIILMMNKLLMIKMTT